MPGLKVDIPDTGDAQCKCRFQWYDPKDDFVNPVPGDSLNDVDPVVGESSAGVWTDWHSLAQDYTINYAIPSESTDEDMIHKGSMLRVQLEVKDTASNGVTTTIANAAVDAINAGTKIWIPNDKQAKFNTGITIRTAGKSGGDAS